MTGAPSGGPWRRSERGSPAGALPQNQVAQAIQDLGVLDNTLFIYIAGDNGSSAEGGPDGTYNELLALNRIVSDISSQLKHIDEWGGPMTFPHFAVGWALAGDEAGDSSYLEVLDAQRNLYQAQLTLTLARRGELASTVTLIQTLGGGW